MPRRPSPRLPTTLTGLACLLVLLVLGLAPRSHVVLCLAKLGLDATPPTARHCCERCCESEPERRDDGPAFPGEERAGAGCPAGCCIDLETRIQLGPTPRGDLPTPPDTATPTLAVLTVPAPVPHPMPREWPHDTGPPRTDRRTTLRATTVLRL